MPASETIGQRLRRALYCKGDVACKPCADRSAAEHGESASYDSVDMPILPGDDEAGPEGLPAASPRRFRLTRGKGGAIRVTYARREGRSQSPACSEAASAWRTGKADKQTYSTLAHCRAMAATRHAAKLHEMAGNTAKAAHLHKVATSQFVTKKSRLARAKALHAQRDAGPGGGAAQAQAQPAASASASAPAASAPATKPNDLHARADAIRDAVQTHGADHFVRNLGKGFAVEEIAGAKGPPVVYKTRQEARAYVEGLPNAARMTADVHQPRREQAASNAPTPAPEASPANGMSAAPGPASGAAPGSKPPVAPSQPARPAAGTPARPSVAERRSRVLGKIESTREASNRGPEGSPERRQALRNAGRDVLARGAANAAEAGSPGYFSKIKARREGAGGGASAGPAPGPGAAPARAQAPTPASSPSPGSIPEDVRDHVKRALGSYRDRAEQVRRGAEVARNPMVGGGRRYVDDTRRNVGKPARSDVKDFLAAAKENGIPGKAAVKEIAGEVLPRTKGDPLAGVRSVKPDAARARAVLDKVRGVTPAATPAPAPVAPAPPSLKDQAAAHRAARGGKPGDRERRAADIRRERQAGNPGSASGLRQNPIGDERIQAERRKNLAARNARNVDLLKEHLSKGGEAMLPSYTKPTVHRHPENIVGVNKSGEMLVREGRKDVVAIPAKGPQERTIMAGARRSRAEELRAKRAGKATPASPPAPSPLPSHLADFRDRAVKHARDKASKLTERARRTNDPDLKSDAADLDRAASHAASLNDPGFWNAQANSGRSLDAVAHEVREHMRKAGRGPEVLRFAPPSRGGQGQAASNAAGPSSPTAQATLPRTSPVPGLPKQPHEMTNHELQHHYDADPEFAKAWDSRYAGSPVNPLYHRLYLNEAKNHGAKVPEHLLGEGQAPTPAPAPSPSLKEAAAAHRASKGTRAERLAKLGEKMHERYMPALERRGELTRQLDAEVKGPVRSSSKKKEAAVHGLRTKINDLKERMDRRSNRFVRLNQAVGQGAAPSAAARPASLKEQAASKRSTKGTRSDRLNVLQNRGAAQFDRRQSGGRINEATVIAMRRMKLRRQQEELGAAGGGGKDEGFSLGRPRASSPGFSNSGSGKTLGFLDQKKGDLPGQTSLMDKVGSVDTGEGVRPAAGPAAQAPSSSSIHPAIKEGLGKIFGGEPIDDRGMTIQQLAKRSGITEDEAAAWTREAAKKGIVEYDHFNDHDAEHARQFAKVHTDPKTGRPIAAFRIMKPKRLEEMAGGGGPAKPEASSPAAAKQTDAQERRALARNMPKISGGSPVALMGRVETDTARRSKVAGRIKKLHADAVKARTDPASHTNHAPGTITPLNTEHIHFDPERFQYKLGHAANTGSVGSLQGVRKWNPELGGIMQVWKDPGNGKTYVVNGHNRLELANRLGAGRVNVQFIHAPHAEAAKAKGALTNIAEGRGSSIDAANFFRSSGVGKEDLEKHGIPMKEKVATEGLALSRLHEPLFRRVVEGTLHPEKAAMIGAAGLSHPQQQSVVKQIDRAAKSKPITTGHLKELLDNAREAGSVKSQTHDLFGSNEEETSLALHRAKVQEAIRDRLGREKRLFGTVAKSRAAEDLSRAGNTINAEESGKVSREAGNALDVFDLLKNRSGTIAPALNRAAERLHAGEHPKKVIDEAYGHVLGEARKILGQ